MSVEVRVPTVLRQHTGGERVVQADGQTVAAVLDSLVSRYPGLKNELLTDDGQVRQFVNIYVNDEDIRYLNRLDTKVDDGDNLAIVLRGTHSRHPGETRTCLRDGVASQDAVGCNQAGGQPAPRQGRGHLAGT